MGSCLAGCAHVTAPTPLSGFASANISQAAHLRNERMLAASQKRDIPVPRDFRRLMDAAMHTNWPAVSNAYARVWPRSHQYESNRRLDPRITTELWNPVHETYWIAYYFAEGWSARLAQDYVSALLENLPENSLVFAGTDTSRFVAAPLAENGLRPDLFFISLNALADSLYMDYVEDVYGNRLWIPNPDQRLAAFKRLIDEVKTGRYATPFIKADGSAIPVVGVEGIGEINAVLVEDIHQHNQSAHRVFFDEGYSHPRLRPRLKPHGLLLELCPEPIVSISPEEVADDMAYWDKLEKTLFATPGFADSQANLRMIAENDMELIGCRQVLLGTDRTGSMDICVGLDLVIEAQKQISLKVGASGIVIDPSGVSVIGPMIKQNSGGAPSAARWGSNFSIDPAHAAHSTRDGQVIEPIQQLQAQALRNAALAGQPFCAECEAARAALEALMA